MKRVVSLFVIGSALVLSACGGSSDSSSYTGTKKLGNGNVYTCPSESALNSCSNDNTCAVSCKLTTENVKPVKPNTPSNDSACKIEGTNVFGKNGTSCLTSVPFLNSGKESTVDCSSNGTLVLSNGIRSTSGSISLNGYTFTCR